MPKLSVVVPIYNVEEYLEACLDSIAAQTFDDLEVVLVDDGSTDTSAQIAARYAGRDPRFKLVHRPNGGLSAARNTGIESATGEYLAFVDSDDVLPHNAYELLVGSLEETGSDIATGKVQRLTVGGIKPAPFLSATFRETRLKTHITKFRELLADRIAWNKVFRRSYWDAQGLRFPEGRLNEDIPVILPLHFSAQTVDVIAEPVYLWRVREVGELSITERRLEPRALLHRIQAVSDVHDYLAEHGPRAAKRWYDESLVADDLKYYLNVLDRADDEYRELFLEKVNALLDRADDAIYDGLPAIERLKWHLVRRRLMPELIEVIRFQRDDLAERTPVRRGRHWLGDYPFLGDERLGIPDEVYRLDEELTLTAHIDEMRLDGGRLRIEGWAFIDGVGAPEQGSQRVELSLLRPGRLRRLRYLVGAVRLATRSVHRPDANSRSGQGLADVSWAGFEATLDPRRLRRARRWRPGTWELYVTVKAGGVRRIRKAFRLTTLRPVRAVELPGGRAGSLLMRAAPTEDREVVVEVADRWAALASHRLHEGVLELTGRLRGIAGDDLRLQLRAAAGRQRKRYPLEVGAGGAFTARVPLDEAAELEPPPRGPVDDRPPEPEWELWIAGGGRPVRLALPEAAAQPPGTWRAGAKEIALARTQGGDASLVVRAPRAVLRSASWAGDGTLRVAVDRPAGWDGAELVLFSAERLVQHAFPMQRNGDEGLTGTATPAAIASLAGSLPLPEGGWELCVRPEGATEAAELVAVTPDTAVAVTMPAATVVGHKPLTLVTRPDGDAALVVGRDLDGDEQGPYHQRRLRRTAYTGRRAEPLTDTVVYSSFLGRQYSDSPRAIHEELVRRGAPLEHLWVVRDGACVVPETANVLREGSREYHEALARARYVVSNDHFPTWFERRPDQTCVQTWHGTPLKRLGFDVSQLRGQARKFERGWSRQIANWQFVVSPNRFSTPILQRAYDLQPQEMLETGYPRVDVLAAPDREARTRALRERLGVPEGMRTVLYAPTFRDHVRDRRGRYRLDLQLDLERLREAVGPDTILLLRKHHYVVDDVPRKPEGFVRDVSSYPDGTELLLAADVLVTDYSSVMVDYANTRRPMLFFTYDIEAYRDEIRGLYVDLEATVPGPLLRTSDQVAEALRDLDAVRSQYADRYDTFVERFCELDDGGAAARVVDRVFAGRADRIT